MESDVGARTCSDAEWEHTNTDKILLDLSNFPPPTDCDKASDVVVPVVHVRTKKGI